MDLVAVGVGTFLLLGMIQLYREWHHLGPDQRKGNVLLILGLTVAVVIPAGVAVLDVDPRVMTVLRVAGFLLVLGAALVIIR